MYRVSVSSCKPTYLFIDSLTSFKIYTRAGKWHRRRMVGMPEAFTSDSWEPESIPLLRKKHIRLLLLKCEHSCRFFSAFRLSPGEHDVQGWTSNGEERMVTRPPHFIHGWRKLVIPFYYVPPHI